MKKLILAMFSTFLLLACGDTSGSGGNRAYRGEPPAVDIDAQFAPMYGVRCMFINASQRPALMQLLYERYPQYQLLSCTSDSDFDAYQAELAYRGFAIAEGYKGFEQFSIFQMERDWIYEWGRMTSADPINNDILIFFGVR
jgi:hypothetical protein